MSEFHYKLIPTIPDYVPEVAAREAALARLKSFLPDARQVTAEVRERVEFVPAMGNFETVSCPACGTILDDKWWVRAMDTVYGPGGFTNLAVTLPCCGAASSLNDLRYYFPQGFARCVLSAFEPNVPDLEDWQIYELEEVLDCTLREIWVHI
jgi:hypothetical protein